MHLTFTIDINYVFNKARLFKKKSCAFFRPGSVAGPVIMEATGRQKFVEGFEGQSPSLINDAD